jgi:hypothetical protein
MVLNRVQLAVLAFFGIVYCALVIILIAAPEVYEGTFRSLASPRSTYSAVFLAALFVFLVLLGVSVIRRWRWVFWLLLIAFLPGGLRIPLSVLQLSALVPSDMPRWYVRLQGLIGAAQLAVGVVMLLGYRKGATADRTGEWAGETVEPLTAVRQGSFASSALISSKYRRCCRLSFRMNRHSPGRTVTDELLAIRARRWTRQDQSAAAGVSVQFDDLQILGGEFFATLAHPGGEELGPCCFVVDAMLAEALDTLVNVNHAREIDCLFRRCRVIGRLQNSTFQPSGNRLVRQAKQPSYRDLGHRVMRPPELVLQHQSELASELRVRFTS